MSLWINNNIKDNSTFLIDNTKLFKPRTEYSENRFNDLIKQVKRQLNTAAFFIRQTTIEGDPTKATTDYIITQQTLDKQLIKQIGEVNLYKLT